MSYMKRIHEQHATWRAAARLRARGGGSRAWAERIEMCWASDVPAPYVLETFGEDIHMGLLDDVFGNVRKSGGDRAADDPALSKLFPSLAEMMMATPTKDGKRRTVSTVTLVCEDGVWKAGLRDRDHAVSLWVSGDGLQGALGALEKALTERPVAWRKTPEAYNRARKNS
jgi:hypothetical protein